MHGHEGRRFPQINSNFFHLDFLSSNTLYITELIFALETDERMDSFSPIPFHSNVDFACIKGA